MLKFLNPCSALSAAAARVIMLLCVSGVLTLFAPNAAVAQNAASSPASPPPAGEQPSDDKPLTLYVRSRAVLTDVTVLDGKGNPVHGLPKSDFTILDNGKPQKIASFEEHTGGDTEEAQPDQSQDGLYSNALLTHPPKVINVLLIDSAFMHILDQMFLYQQLTRFVNDLPKDEPVAIYARTGDYTVPLQTFTTDHEKLMAAVKRAIPHIHPPADYYYGDFATLQQMLTYLAQVPGRKNVFWLSSGGHLDLLTDPTAYPMWIDPRELYNQLEKERIAIYPVDVRGLTVNGGSRQIGQHQMMNEVAAATGGQPIYNSNGISGDLEKAIKDDGSYYTITYNPTDLKNDNKWHKVKVEIAGGRYNLSYRTGYYDDPRRESLPAMRFAKGEAPSGPDKASDPSSLPIPVKARVLPASAAAVPANLPVSKASQKRHQVLYDVHFEVPASDFRTVEQGGGKSVATLGFAALSYNEYGRSTGSEGRRVIMTLDDAALRAHPDGKLSFDQQISLPKGEDFLFLAVWDMRTGRLGTVQVALDVKKPEPQ